MILVMVIFRKRSRIGHREGFWHPRNRRDFGNRTRGQFGGKEDG
jgi:hypothetical protein